MRSFLRFFLNVLSGHIETEELAKKNIENSQKKAESPPVVLPEPHSIVGIIGATGHGKSALHQALHTKTKDWRKSSTISKDNPIRYADGAILVISVAEGIVPETRKCLAILRHFGIGSIVVYLNRFSPPDEDRTQHIEQEVRALLSHYDVNNEITQVISGNAVNPDSSNIQALLKVVESHIPVSERDYDKPFLMIADDIFSITGKGTIATGWVIQGKLNINEQIEIVGLRPTRQTVAIHLEQFHKACYCIFGSSNAGMLIRGVNRTDIELGQVITRLGTFQTHSRFSCTLSSLTKEEGGEIIQFAGKKEVQFSFYNSNIPGWLHFLETGENILPGNTIEFIGETTFPYVIEQGHRFLTYVDL